MLKFLKGKISLSPNLGQVCSYIVLFKFSNLISEKKYYLGLGYCIGVIQKSKVKAETKRSILRENAFISNNFPLLKPTLRMHIVYFQITLRYKSYRWTGIRNGILRHQNVAFSHKNCEYSTWPLLQNVISTPIHFDRTKLIVRVMNNQSHPQFWQYFCLREIDCILMVQNIATWNASFFSWNHHKVFTLFRFCVKSITFK